MQEVKKKAHFCKFDFVTILFFLSVLCLEYTKTKLKNSMVSKLLPTQALVLFFQKKQCKEKPTREPCREVSSVFSLEVS